MARVQPKATPNWCSQVKPDEPWTGRCTKEKIADDGKRHGQVPTLLDNRSSDTLDSEHSHSKRGIAR